MRFKDEKGRVFEDIEAVLFEFRCPGPCGHGCPLYDPSRSYGLDKRHPVCKKYVVSHPVEAARLMDYEVIEDNRLEFDTVKPVEIDRFKNQAKKPRICEVLGVDVGEHFKVDGYRGEYHINDSGVLKWGGQTSDDAIYEVINHPEKIIRKPRFTDEEIADAKALKHFYHGIAYIYRDRSSNNIIRVFAEGNAIITSLNKETFPSIRPGETVRLSDILGGTEK